MMNFGERFQWPDYGLSNWHDVTLWAEWIFFLPGDFIFRLLDDTQLGRFLDVDSHRYGDWLSAIISLVVWLFVFSTINDLLFSRRRGRDSRSYTSRIWRRDGRRATDRAVADETRVEPKL